MKKETASFIPFCEPWIDQKEIDEVVDTLKIGWITTGPKTRKFEKVFADYVGARYAVALNSCTAGLHLGLIALNILPGDEVITSVYTFTATAAVICHCNAIPILADIDRETLNILPEEIERKITSRTKAIIPVHIAGYPCEMRKIKEIAKKYGLAIIEDAAHALGAFYMGSRIGSNKYSDVCAFSFHSIKNITTGEGGMVTTNKKKVADRIRRLSLHGLSTIAWERYKKLGNWYYKIDEAGFKYNMTDIAASLGLAQMKKLNKFLKIRKKYFQMYTNAFKDLETVILPAQASQNITPSYHLYIIKLALEKLKIKRAQFINELSNRGIGTSVHYIPLALHPYYQKVWGYKPDDFPNAIWVYERAVSLPLYPKMTKSDVERVINAVIDICKKYKK